MALTQRGSKEGAVVIKYLVESPRDNIPICKNTILDICIKIDVVATGQKHLEMRKLGPHRLDVAFYFVLHTTQYTTADSRFGIIAHSGYFALSLNQRQTGRELMQSPQTHLHPRSNIAAPIITTCINHFIGNASTGIDDKEILAWLERTGTDDSRKSVTTQSLWRSVTICNRHRGIRRETQDRKWQTRKGFSFTGSKITHCADNTTTEIIFARKSIQLGEDNTFRTYLFDRLITLESNHLDDSVSYVYY